MKIDFNAIEEISHPSFKGGRLHADLRTYLDSLNRIMKGRLVAGASIGLHTHTDNSEIIFITSGEAIAITDGKEERLKAGDCHYCPKGSSHTLINDSGADLLFLAVVPNQ